MDDNGLGLAAFVSDGAQDADPPEETEAPPEETPSVEEEPESPAKEEPPAKEAGQWDSDDNPWKKRTEKLEERYKETRDWATKINAELEIMRKELKGETPEEPSQEQQTQLAAMAARVQASTEAAFRIYGKDKVQKLILDEDSPFRELEKNDAIRQRVLMDPAPTIVAMELVEQEQFFEKYGRKPEDIRSAIRAEYEAEMTQEKTNKAEAAAAEKAARREAQPQGVAGTRGETRPPEKPNGFAGPPSIRSLFNADIV